MILKLLATYAMFQKYKSQHTTCFVYENVVFINTFKAQQNNYSLYFSNVSDAAKNPKMKYFGVNDQYNQHY